MMHSGATYMTPQAFTEHHGARLRQALPKLVDLPILNNWIQTAMSEGMNWGQGFASAVAQQLAIASLREAGPGAEAVEGFRAAGPLHAWEAQASAQEESAQR